MGCGNTNYIKTNNSGLVILPTKLPKIDELFLPAKTILLTLKSILKDFNTSEKYLKHLTYTHILLNSSVLDSAKSFLLFLVVASGNNFEYFELKLTQTSPYISMNNSKLDPRQKQILDSWEKFAENVEVTEKKLVEIENEFKIIFEEVPKIDLASKEVCNSSGLDPSEAANAIKITMSNLKVMNGIGEMIRKHLGEVEEIKRSYAGLVEKCGNGKLEEIFRLGVEIRNSHVKKIRDVIINYWPESERVDLDLENKGKAVYKISTNA